MRSLANNKSILSTDLFDTIPETALSIIIIRYETILESTQGVTASRPSKNRTRHFRVIRFKHFKRPKWDAVASDQDREQGGCLCRLFFLFAFVFDCASSRPILGRKDAPPT